MSITSGPLPPVSEIPRPSGITAISHSVPLSTKNISSGIVTTLPTTIASNRIENMPVLSEVSTYEIPSLGTPALKLFVPLSSVTSIHRSVTTSMQNITTIPSKESAVALVCSLAPKKEPSSKVVPLPSVLEIKSGRANHLQNLTDVKESRSFSVTSANIKTNTSSPVSVAIETNTIPVNNGETNISVLSVPSTCTELTGLIKVDENHKQISHLNQRNCVTSSVAQYPLHLQNGNVAHTDLSHVVIPVASKLDDNQIIIPLTSSAVYSQPVGISIPINGNAVPVQVSSDSVPESSVLVAPGTACRTTDTDSSSVGVPVIAVTSGAAESPRSGGCATASDLSGIRIPITTSTSAPVTSVSVSTPTSTSLVFTTHSSISSIEPTVTTYSMQSPAEILSQLSKAGVLPTMSSSQVSSVLSALGSDTCHLDLETDGTHHVELLTQQQVLHMPSSADKVSALTQTDELELMRSADIRNTLECSSKLAQALNGSHETVGTNDARLLDQILNHPNTCTNTDAAFLSSHIILSNKNTSLSRFPSQEVAVQPNNPGQSSGNCINNSHSGASIKAAANIDALLNQASKSQQNIKFCNSKQLESTNKGISSAGHEFCKQEDFEQRKGIRNITSKRKKLHCVNEVINSKVKNKRTISTKTDEVACYKCICCPFLSLDMKVVGTHVQNIHGSQRKQCKTLTVKCPGCENLFFSSKSLKVHLVQDHQVRDEELKTMVSLSIRSAYKSADVKRKKLKPSVNESQVLLSYSVKTLAAIDKDVHQPIALNEVAVDETSKIRVRNLNKDTDSSPSPVVAIASVQIHENAREENSLSGNSASEGDLRDGILVIDDDPLLQQRQAKLNIEDNCELKIIKTDAENTVQCSSELVLCEEIVDNKKQQHEMKSLKKKRGRPKGSKNVPSTVYRKMDSCLKPGEKPLGYRCYIDGCAVQLRSHDNIEYHRRCHNGDKFCCPECSQEISHWNGLSTHLWRYHLIDMELYSCDQCDYKTNSFSKLMNLHHRIHGDERPFLCDICGKGFKNPKQMRNHKAIHVAKLKQKIYPLGECDVCGRTFTNPRMLRLHKDNVHGKLRPHLCNFCGYSASSRSTLKMHMRKHTGEKPFQCEQCSYQTSDHNSLRRHKMRHSGDKPYKCPHCSYACIQSSTYKAHLKTKHPGQESGLMFSCHICSFRSVRKDNYMAHMADHDTSTNSSSKHKKYSTSQPEDYCSKPESTKEESRKAEKSGQATDVTIRENALDEACIDERRLVEIPSDSVIHLVEEFDDASSINGQQQSENIQTLCVASVETVTQVQLTPEFEAEEITGDIQHTREPQELKFKVAEDMAS